eukprot:649804-Prorocentrum_minimum.AAC.1
MRKWVIDPSHTSKSVEKYPLTLNIGRRCCRSFLEPPALKVCEGKREYWKTTKGSAEKTTGAC